MTSEIKDLKTPLYKRLVRQQRDGSAPSTDPLIRVSEILGFIGGAATLVSGSAPIISKVVEVASGSPSQPGGDVFSILEPSPVNTPPPTDIPTATVDPTLTATPKRSPSVDPTEVNDSIRNKNKILTQFPPTATPPDKPTLVPSRTPKGPDVSPTPGRVNILGTVPQEGTPLDKVVLWGVDKEPPAHPTTKYAENEFYIVYEMDVVIKAAYKVNSTIDIYYSFDGNFGSGRVRCLDCRSVLRSNLSDKFLGIAYKGGSGQIQTASLGQLYPGTVVRFRVMFSKGKAYEESLKDGTSTIYINVNSGMGGMVIGADLFY